MLDSSRNRGNPQPPLEWLIQPFSLEQFFDEYWERRPLVVRRDRPSYYDSLLTLDEIDRVLATPGLRYSNVALKNAARDVVPAEYTTAGGSLDIARVYQLFHEGSTVTLAYMDDVIPALTELCRGLEAQFCHPFQTNVYLTPPGNQGAKVHYDTHDVIVLQVTGSKRWSTYGTPVELPLKSQAFDPEAIRDFGEPTLQFEMTAGDAAYIPRGVGHEARTTDSVSLHVTVGILAYTWTDFVLEAVAETCLNQPAFRKALPPGFARNGIPQRQRQEIFERLRRHLSEPSLSERVRGRFVDEFFSSCPPLLRGQMTQLAALDAIRMGTTLQVRAQAITLLESAADSVSVRHFGGRIRFPPHVEPAIRFALERRRFAVRDLPGDLDDAGKLTLVRRLVREGLLVADPT